MNVRRADGVSDEPAVERVVGRYVLCDEVAAGGMASLSNLARLCHWHHYLKTHHGHRLERIVPEGASTPGGGWRWITPEDPPVVPRAIRRSG